MYYMKVKLMVLVMVMEMVMVMVMKHFKRYSGVPYAGFFRKIMTQPITKLVILKLFEQP